MSETTNDKPQPSPTPADAAGASQPRPLPRYEKPVLRRYDQIEQVRPYGPSEI